VCVLLKGGWAEIRQHCKKLMFVNESQQSPSRKQTDISTKSDFDSNLEWMGKKCDPWEMSPSILTELEMQKDYRANDLPNKMCQIKIDKGGNWEPQKRHYSFGKRLPTGGRTKKRGFPFVPFECPAMGSTLSNAQPKRPYAK